MRKGVAWLSLLLVWALAAGAQAPAEAPPPGDMPPGAEPPPEEALGEPQAAARLRDGIALPFINETGSATNDFWSLPLSMLLAGTPSVAGQLSSIDGSTTLVIDYEAKRWRSDRPAEQRRALEQVGGDTLVVTRYSLDGGDWVLKSALFEADAPAAEPFAEVTARGEGPYPAVAALADALAPHLGVAQAQPQGGEGMPGEMPPGEPGMPPGEPGAPPGEPGMPAGPEAPPVDPAMPPGEMGMPPGEGGMPAPTVAVVENLDIENWARGIDAWPYRRPTDAFRGDLAKALDFHERQIQVEPRFNLGYTLAAATLVAAGEPERGIEIQRAWVESKEPNAADTHNLGVVYSVADRMEEASETFLRALELPGGPIISDAVLAGTVLAQAERYEEAAAILRQMIERFPLVLDLYINLGRVYLELEQPKDAVPLYQRAVAMAPGLVDGYEGLTRAWKQQGAYSHAVAVARRAAQVVDGNWRSWQLLAEAEMDYGRLRSAADAAQRAQRLAGNQAGPLLVLGQIHLTAGEYDEAARVFTAALRNSPDSNRAQRLLGRTRLFGQDLEEAGKLLEAAMLQAAPDELPPTARDYALVEFYRGNYDRSLDLLRLALDFDADDAEALMYRSFVRAYQGEEAAAWEDFVAALERGPSGPLLQQALQVFGGAAEAQPPVPVAMVAAGVLQERFGNVNDARIHYRKYRALRPPGFLGDYVDERLEATKGGR